MVAKLAKKYSRGVGKPSFLLVHLVSVSLSLLLSMTLPPFHQARITDTYRLLCHLWQAMLSYASCRLLYRIQRWSFFSLEQEREFPSLALSFYFGFSHLYELNLGNNKKAAGNNACGLIRVFCNFSNLLHNQLLRRVAEHDGINTLRQIAKVYS